MMFKTDEELEEVDEERKKFLEQENPFRFPSAEGHSPTFQKDICLSATSHLHVDISDDEEDPSSSCGCPSTATSSLLGAPPPSAPSVTSFPSQTRSITDDYSVSQEIIGEGESGKVMACYRLLDGAKFALKVLRDSPKARREVDLHYLASDHDNIVSIVDVYENAFRGTKCLLIIVEYMEGGDLLTQFEKQGSQPYPEKKVGKIISQIGSAVQYLHDMNIAHRDIKLENILCSSWGDDCIYKLADFGFAKRPERNTLMESPCCTPFYAPPEVICRERYNKSCDMWSLGVAMYILLCGYPPFYSMKGLHTLSPGMRSRISNGFYAFPHAEWDVVSDETKAIIKSLLRTNPSERLTIYELMQSRWIRGEQAEAAAEAVESEENDDIAPEIPVPRSVRFLREGIKAPRLHSIQEEVGRVLERMQLAEEAEKDSPAACASLLARRHRSSAIAIRQVPA